MRSPNRTYSRELDELRAAAALLVFFYHGTQPFLERAGFVGWPQAVFPPTAILFEGHIGVGLFMVLSGFVLSRGTFGHPLSYAGFLKNRALRILPLMFVALVCALYGSRGYRLEGIVASFGMLTNTPLAFADTTRIAGTLWTVAVEFQFYLVAPFLFAFVGRRGWNWLFGAVSLACFFKCLTLYQAADDSARIYLTHDTIVGRLCQFLAGIGLAYGFHVWKPSSRAFGFAVLAVSSVGVVAFAYALNRGGGFTVWHPWRLAETEVEGLLWAGVIGGYTLARPFDWRYARFVSFALAFVGTLSFSIYVLHWPMLAVLGHAQFIARTFVPAVNPSTLLGIEALVGLFFLPVTVAVCWLSYTVLEKPFLDMRSRYILPAAGRDEEAEAEARAPVVVLPLRKQS